MQAQPSQNAPSNFPIHELDQIESVIQASLQLVATLSNRRETLATELERLTRPQNLAKKVPMKTIGPGFEYRGELVVRWNYIDIHVALLRRLWEDFPERRDAMAEAMGHYGTTRVYVAKSIAELFPARRIAWAKRYSRPLVSDWYVDTNLNRERMKRILPAAVKAAGLRWGADVKAYWTAKPIAN